MNTNKLLEALKTPVFAEKSKHLPELLKFDRLDVILASTLIFLTASCSDGNKAQNEPVSEVPAVEIRTVDAKGRQEVFLDGKQVKAGDYFNQYCVGVNSETCRKVQIVWRINARNDGGAKPTNW